MSKTLLHLELTEQEKAVLKEWVASLGGELLHPYSENMIVFEGDSDDWDLTVDNEVRDEEGRVWSMTVNRNSEELSAVVYESWEDAEWDFLGEEYWKLPSLEKVGS